MKLCKDCKHFRAPKYAEVTHLYAHCARATVLSAVTGELEADEEPYCRFEREVGLGVDLCGPEAKYFEERSIQEVREFLKTPVDQYGVVP